MDRVEFQKWARGIVSMEYTADVADRHNDEIPDPEAKRLCNEHTAKFRELVDYLRSRLEVKL